MKRILENTKYTRLEVEQIFEPHKEHAGQRAYYSIKNGEIGFCWMKKGSIYSNRLVSNNQIEWEDSVGQRSTTGQEFFEKMKNYKVYMFIADHEKSKEYFFVGEVSKTELLKPGDRIEEPGIYKITFVENIPSSARHLLIK